MHILGYLAWTFVFYFGTAYVAMTSVLTYPYIHNVVRPHLTHVGAVQLVANAIPPLSLVYGMCTTPSRTTLVRRICIMYMWKAVLQTVTISPTPNGVDTCRNFTLLDMMAHMDNCADMMFSGHTALTMLTLPPHIRMVVVAVLGTCLVLGRMHYISDVLVAVIVSQWLEYTVRMPGGAPGAATEHAEHASAPVEAQHARASGAPRLRLHDLRPATPRAVAPVSSSHVSQHLLPLPFLPRTSRHRR